MALCEHQPMLWRPHILLPTPTCDGGVAAYVRTVTHDQVRTEHTNYLVISMVHSQDTHADALTAAKTTRPRNWGSDAAACIVVGCHTGN